MRGNEILGDQKETVMCDTHYQTVTSTYLQWLLYHVTLHYQFISDDSLLDNQCKLKQYSSLFATNDYRLNLFYLLMHYNGLCRCYFL